MSVRSDDRRTVCAAIATLAGLATGLSGCGWTARDEFLARRQTTLSPQSGDGSRLTTRLPDDPFRAQAGHATVAADGER